MPIRGGFRFLKDNPLTCLNDVVVRWKQSITWTYDALTLNVRGPSYLCFTRSISWLLMPWLLMSPGHQQQWYWLCRIGRSLSYLRKDFNYQCHINVEECIKCKYMYLFPLKNLEHNGLMQSNPMDVSSSVPTMPHIMIISVNSLLPSDTIWRRVNLGIISVWAKPLSKPMLTSWQLDPQENISLSF